MIQLGKEGSEERSLSRGSCMPVHSWKRCANNCGVHLGFIRQRDVGLPRLPYTEKKIKDDIHTWTCTQNLQVEFPGAFCGFLKCKFTSWDHTTRPPAVWERPELKVLEHKPEGEGTRLSPLCVGWALASFLPLGGQSREPPCCA